MIWTQPGDGIYQSGYYRILRETRDYSAWFNHPKSYRLISRVPTLKQAKQDCVDYAQKHG